MPIDSVLSFFPRRSGILPFPDCPRFCRLMKTRNRRYSRTSGMDGDKSGESGVFLFSRRVPDFCDGRQSFPTNENSKLYRRGRRRWISLITSPLNCWAPLPLLKINMASLENLRQTSGDYPIYRQNLGWQKVKFPIVWDLTIIPWARMGSESIAHEAEGRR